MKIIGLGNKARNGKDTIAQHLVEIDPRRVKTYSFGLALKSFCRVMGLMEVKDGPLLQTMGTEVFRRIDPDKWVRVLDWQLQEEKPSIAVIADCRFENEAKWIRSQSGVLVRIKRMLGDIQFITKDRPADHPSEIGLDGFDWDSTYEIQDGDRDGLRKAAEDIYTKYIYAE